MLLGCIADDFTGASDLANTLAKGGMATVQFSGVPTAEAPAHCEAGVVALKTRSIAPEQAIAQSLEALAWLRAQGCRQFVFKYCSTFDSTPEGNIGPVAEALLEALEAESAIVCPVFPATGRTLFMGHLFVNGRLLNESGMENHPLNPMSDADIVRWLGRQARTPVGLVPYAAVREGETAIRRALGAQTRGGARLVVVDAVVDDDLHAIGRAVADARLITGGSGIALGLPENFRAAGELADAGSGFEPLAGAAVALSGSCSTTSMAQVEHHVARHPGLAVSAADLMDDKMTVATALEFVEAHRDERPIVYSTAAPDEVRAIQARHGREAVAERVETFFAELARALVDAGIRQLVVGGGETSGAVTTALDLDTLVIGPEIDPGVPAMAVNGDRPLRIALKSGNFGATDFYDKAMNKLGGEA